MKQSLNVFSSLVLVCGLASPALASETVELSLGKVLELAGGQNTELALQMERVVQAELERDIAWYNWIPDLRGGRAVFRAGWLFAKYRWLD